MQDSNSLSNLELKAVILAAGREEESDYCSNKGEDIPMALRPLGDRKIIDYVIQNVLQVVSRQDLYIVLGYRKEKIQEYLGTEYNYVLQEEQLGTGHAVQQLYPLLKNFKGNLLILYGDTPLFRSSSIRGLLNRHFLCNAQLTILTAIIDRLLPYGRIIRDDKENIIDIIEDMDASPEIRRIRELNIGAYVVDVQNFFSIMQKLSSSPEKEGYRLTDYIRRFISSDLRVESYHIYDEDEIQGINTCEDLSHAEIILKKRLFKPKRYEEESLITFGTGGWRAVIGGGFTLNNVRRLSQTLSNRIIRQGEEKMGVLIGYDRRFLSKQAAETASEVFAGNNIPVIILTEDAPTPLITYATAKQKVAYGLAFTASHNPPEWNGLKVFHGDGSLLLSDETNEIENETNSLKATDVIKIDLDIALRAKIVQYKNFTNDYVDEIETLLDLNVIRNAGLKVIVDTMYGVGHVTLGIILTEARCRVTFIHERHDPLFGGISPAPDLEALKLLITHVEDGGYDLGLATDGDADRIAIIDERGEYITINDILLLLYWYLHEIRNEKGGVVRNLATTHLLDRLASHFGEKCYEVPVGFKYIASGMVEHNAVLGGESSGGLTIRGHILGKDGIFASGLIIEMLARTGKKISQLRKIVYDITGRLYTIEENVPATPEMRILVPRQLKEAPIDKISHYKILNISYIDGIKFLFENDNWALLRFSGTEPLLRLFVEADSDDKARELINGLKKFIKI